MAFGPELVTRGTGEGVAPTLIALLGLAALFLPIAVSGGASGLEIVQPMAVVICGGIVATALLNLLVVPILYAGTDRVTDRDAWAEDLMEPAMRRAGPATQLVQRDGASAWRSCGTSP